MDPITTVMRQCRLFDGIPKRNIKMYWPAFGEKPNRFVGCNPPPDRRVSEAARRCDGWDAADLPV